MSPTRPETSVDVLIIGAGPAGLMSALALAQAGVHVKLIDKRAEHEPYGQADGLMPRTMEILQSYGLLDALVNKGMERLSMAALYNPDPNNPDEIKRTALIAVHGGVKSPYQHAATLIQSAIEKVFLERLVQLGVVVDRPVKPACHPESSAFIFVDPHAEKLEDPEAYPIKVTVERRDAANRSSYEVINAKFLIGADGAHSKTRDQLGIAMEGENTDHVWGAMDITLTSDSNFPDWRNVCTIKAAQTTILSIPRENDLLRLYVNLGLVDGMVDPVTGRVAPDGISQERFLEIAERAFNPYKLKHASVVWWTRYIVGQRVAARFSIKERAFIAGDACHTHSPKAGQGMNVSIQDAYNLGWKIAYVSKGWAKLDILKTYESERRKFAQELINFDKYLEASFSVKARSEIFKDEDIDEVPTEPMEAFQKFDQMTSGVGIKYAPSCLIDDKTSSQHFAPGLPLGQRLPPQIVIRAGDFKTCELQELCPSNNLFKILIFPGNIKETPRMDTLKRFEMVITGGNGVLKRFETKFGGTFVDIMCIVIGEKATTSYFDVPSALRAHWSKVFLDTKDVTDSVGGSAYASFGIQPEGAVAIIRPDGHVCLICGVDEPEKVEAYFGTFMMC